MICVWFIDVFVTGVSTRMLLLLAGYLIVMLMLIGWTVLLFSLFLEVVGVILGMGC